MEAARQRRASQYEKLDTIMSLLAIDWRQLLAFEVSAQAQASPSQGIQASPRTRGASTSPGARNNQSYMA